MAYLDLNGLKYFLGKLKPRLVPSGAVQAFAGTSVPTGWLLCNGQAVSRSSYAALFGVIGTKYGSGDGKTTFHLPNLNGYTIIGGNSSEVGTKVGAKTHVLSENELPPHSHAMALSVGNGVTNDAAQKDNFHMGSWWKETKTLRTYKDGGDNRSHNNMQPSVYMTYIIKV